VPTDVGRLFVALPVPPPVAQALVALQPTPGDGVRLLAAADFHLTLHFLGSREISPVREALQDVAGVRPSVTLTQPGQFRLNRRRRVLWIGVDSTEALTAIHAGTALALKAVGYEPESRPFRPHITLARLAASVPTVVVDAFLASSVPVAAAAFDCDRFALFRSETAPEGARYRVIESWPLGSDG